MEGYHHGVFKILAVCVVFNLLRENVARVDDSRDVIDVHIFRLIDSNITFGGDSLVFVEMELLSDCYMDGDAVYFRMVKLELECS